MGFVEFRENIVVKLRDGNAGRLVATGTSLPSTTTLVCAGCLVHGGAFGTVSVTGDSFGIETAFEVASATPDCDTMTTSVFDTTSVTTAGVEGIGVGSNAEDEALSPPSAGDTLVALCTGCELNEAVETDAGVDVETGSGEVDPPSEAHAKLMALTLAGERTGPSSVHFISTYGQQILPSAIVTISPAT